MNENNGVSVVICCYNSSKRITTTLEHLQKMKTNGIPWEVVIVDNRSDDDTTGIAQKVWNSNPVTQLKIVTENNRGLMNARIKGVANCSYDFISFIDDDNWIESLWVDKVFSIMQKDPTIAACGGSSEAVFEINPPDWFNEFTFYYAVGKQQNESGYVTREKAYLWGAGLTLRKKAWNNLYENEFNNLLKGRTGKALTAGEDSELCFALVLRGWKLWYDESLKFKHYIPKERLTIQYLMKIYEGFGKAAVILSLYLESINGISESKSNWFWRSMTSMKNMFFAGLKWIFSTASNKIKNKSHWLYDKAYTFELLSNRKRYIKAREQIKMIHK